MTGDKNKFITLKKYDGGSVKFAREEVAQICGIGSILIHGKHEIEGVYYV